jgi:hypothetical protein
LSKPWYKSKTVWFNAASAALIAIESSIHVLQDVLGPASYLPLVGLVAAGNIILRTVSTGKLTR